MQTQAETQFSDNEYAVNSMDVLVLAGEAGCSAHDCEFVSLAMSLNLTLVTGDRKIVQTFPRIAITVREYLRTAL